jgi:hypothetical protein
MRVKSEGWRRLSVLVGVVAGLFAGFAGVTGDNFRGEGNQVAYVVTLMVVFYAAAWLVTYLVGAVVEGFRGVRSDKN